LISQGDLVSAPWYNWDKDWDQPNLPRFSLRSGIVIERSGSGFLTVLWSGGKVESLWSEDDLRPLVESGAAKIEKKQGDSK
jgi:hypothetical protein